MRKNTVKYWVLTIVAAFGFLMPQTAQPQVLYRLYQALKLGEGAYKAYKAYSITDEELQEVMRETIQVMDKENHVASSSNSYAKRLAKITKGMNNVKGVPLNFKVYIDNNTVNAFASPDGSVRVYSKLMDIMTDDEILGVIGHEIGHVAKKHSLKEYKEALLASAARDGLSASSTWGDLAQSTLGGLAEYLINAKYSRTQEAEADDFGYILLKKMGKNPYYLPMALQKLQNLEKSSGGKYAKAVETLFSTHPDTANRVSKLSKKAKADGYTKPKK